MMDAAPLFTTWLFILVALGGLGLVAFLVVGLVLFGMSRSGRKEQPGGD
jgi:hypothetical protein